MENEHDNVRVEVDADGASADVEVEVIESDDDIHEPFDPRKIDVTTETRTLDSLIKRMGAGQIDLDPDFQRSRGIWSPAKKSLLIESLLLRIPLPTFYVAEIESEGELGTDTWAVVDGIQRLSTISEFVAPAVLGQSPLVLTKLEYLKSEEGKNFADLSQALQLRILESQFTFQVIRKSTPEPVQLNIFARINTGGVPLSAQELRHALTPGPARELLRELAMSSDYRNAVADSVSPSRMADREMVLRFLAFRMTDPLQYTNQDFNEFLRTSMRTINEWSRADAALARDEFAATMQACATLFGLDAFRKRYSPADPRRPVSKALFEAVAVAVATVQSESRDPLQSRLSQRSAAIQRGFIDLMTDREFDRAISQGTGDPARVRKRFGDLTDLLRRELL